MFLFISKIGGNRNRFFEIEIIKRNGNMFNFLGIESVEVEPIKKYFLNNDILIK